MIVGGDGPEEPYPIHLEGAITHGFGRGARFLGIPTGTSGFAHGLMFHSRNDHFGLMI